MPWIASTINFFVVFWPTFVMYSVIAAHCTTQVRLLIVAPNIDVMEGEGGLDDKVREIVNAAREDGTPVLFALTKYALRVFVHARTSRFFFCSLARERRQAACVGVDAALLWHIESRLGNETLQDRKGNIRMVTRFCPTIWWGSDEFCLSIAGVMSDGSRLG